MCHGTILFFQLLRIIILQNLFQTFPCCAAWIPCVIPLMVENTPDGGDHPWKGNCSRPRCCKKEEHLSLNLHATNHCNATNDEDHLMIPCFFSLRSTWSLFPLEITAMKQTLLIGFLFIWCLALKAMVFATIWSNYIQVPLLLVGLKTVSGSVSLHIVKCRRCRGGSKRVQNTELATLKVGKWIIFVGMILVRRWGK